MIIGVAGTIGSGKGTFSKILVGKGYKMFAFGNEVESFVRENLDERGPLTREKMQYWGNRARVLYGEGFWAERVVDSIWLFGIDDVNGNEVVVDGFRYPDQVEVFRRKYGRDFSLIGIDSPEHVRFERLKRRGREGDPKNWRDFLEMNERDLNGYLHDDGQHTSACLSMADRMIFNRGSLEDFKLKADYLIDGFCRAC